MTKGKCNEDSKEQSREVFMSKAHNEQTLNNCREVSTNPYYREWDKWVEYWPGNLGNGVDICASFAVCDHGFNSVHSSFITCKTKEWVTIGQDGQLHPMSQF